MTKDKYPRLKQPLIIGDEVYDQDRLDSMQLDEVWTIHEIIGDKCGKANTKWNNFRNISDKLKYRRLAEYGVQVEFHTIKEYYWGREKLPTIAD